MQYRLRVMEPTKGLVTMRFCDAPFLKKIRWGKEWWTKTSWKAATNAELHEFEIPLNHLVGIFLKDLNEHQKKNIIK